MYGTAKVVEVSGTEAKVLFVETGIQKTAAVMVDVTVAPDDTAVVLYQDGFTNCLVIGVKE
jgi:hypothetical protein